MRKIILLSVLAIAFFAAKAQEPMFVKGDKVINIGLGIGSYTTISASGEYGFLDGIADKGTIGLGAFVGYGFYNFGSKYYHNSQIIGGARGTFHYPFLKKLDTYGGVNLGLQYVSESWDQDYWGGTLHDYNGSSLGLSSGVFIGARYYFSSNFAAFAEAGYGLGYLTAGISIKL